MSNSWQTINETFYLGGVLTLLGDTLLEDGLPGDR